MVDDRTIQSYVASIEVTLALRGRGLDPAGLPTNDDADLRLIAGNRSLDALHRMVLVEIAIGDRVVPSPEAGAIHDVPVGKPNVQIMVGQETIGLLERDMLVQGAIPRCRKFLDLVHRDGVGHSIPPVVPSDAGPLTKSLNSRTA